MVKHTLFCSTDEKGNTFFYSVLYELVLFLLQFSNHTKELRDNYRNNIVGWFYLNTPTVFNRTESLESLGVSRHLLVESYQWKQQCVKSV